MEKKFVKCCANCKYCIDIPRNNKYGDVDYLCVITGHFIPFYGITKDRVQIKCYSPGGKELECKFEKKQDSLERK